MHPGRQEVIHDHLELGLDLQRQAVRADHPVKLGRHIIAGQAELVAVAQQPVEAALAVLQRTERRLAAALAADLGPGNEAAIQQLRLLQRHQHRLRAGVMAGQGGGVQMRAQTLETVGRGPGDPGPVAAPDHPGALVEEGQVIAQRLPLGEAAQTR